jgi:hypothetical protein
MTNRIHNAYVWNIIMHMYSCARMHIYVCAGKCIHELFALICVHVLIKQVALNKSSLLLII